MIPAINTLGGALRRPLFLLPAAFLALMPMWAATAKKKAATKAHSTAPKRAASRTVPQAQAKTQAKTTTKTGKTTVRTKRAGSRRAALGKRTPSWRNTQMRPTPERYKEVQRALVARGYLNGAPNGVWDESSVAALRRFQSSQNLEPTGKLDSLSLIALGLGPSYSASAPPAGSKPPQNQ